MPSRRSTPPPIPGSETTPSAEVLAIRSDISHQEGASEEEFAEVSPEEILDEAVVEKKAQVLVAEFRRLDTEIENIKAVLSRAMQTVENPEDQKVVDELEQELAESEEILENVRARARKRFGPKLDMLLANMPVVGLEVSGEEPSEKVSEGEKVRPKELSLEDQPAGSKDVSVSQPRVPYRPTHKKEFVFDPKVPEREEREEAQLIDQLFSGHPFTAKNRQVDLAQLRADLEKAAQSSNPDVRGPAKYALGVLRNQLSRKIIQLFGERKFSPDDPMWDTAGLRDWVDAADAEIKRNLQAKEKPGVKNKAKAVVGKLKTFLPKKQKKESSPKEIVLPPARPGEVSVPPENNPEITPGGQPEWELALIPRLEELTTDNVDMLHRFKERLEKAANRDNPDVEGRREARKRLREMYQQLQEKVSLLQKNRSILVSPAGLQDKIWDEAGLRDWVDSLTMDREQLREKAIEAGSVPAVEEAKILQKVAPKERTATPVVTPRLETPEDFESVPPQARNEVYERPEVMVEPPLKPEELFDVSGVESEVKKEKPGVDVSDLVLEESPIEAGELLDPEYFANQLAEREREEVAVKAELREYQALELSSEKDQIKWWQGKFRSEPELEEKFGMQSLWNKKFPASAEAAVAMLEFLTSRAQEKERTLAAEVATLRGQLWAAVEKQEQAKEPAAPVHREPLPRAVTGEIPVPAETVPPLTPQELLSEEELPKTPTSSFEAISPAAETTPPPVPIAEENLVEEEVLPKKLSRRGFLRAGLGVAGIAGAAGVIKGGQEVAKALQERKRASQQAKARLTEAVIAKPKEDISKKIETKSAEPVKKKETKAKKVSTKKPQ